jgi:hypothetical protein
VNTHKAKKKKKEDTRLKEGALSLWDWNTTSGKYLASSVFKI